MQPNYDSSITSKAASVKLVIMDVDGVLSNGHVYYTADGDEIKSFSIKDGLGIKLLHRARIKTAIITGRKSQLLERRCHELGIEDLYQGSSDKRSAFNELLKKHQCSAEQVAYIGDDLPDLPLMIQCGLSACPADAYWLVKQKADWVASCDGGQGCVRELSDLILSAQNQLHTLHQEYLSF